MALEREEMLRVAELAAIALTEEELESFRQNLGSLLRAFDKLQALDVSEVPPTLHPVPGHTPLRRDEVRPSLSPEEALSGAPAREGTSFLVPRIIE